MPQPSWSSGQSNQQIGASSFSLQLAQRTLEETLESAQNPMLEAVRNVHIEILRQFHIQEVLLAFNNFNFSYFYSVEIIIIFILYKCANTIYL